jgi:hypothetical protein
MRTATTANSIGMALARGIGGFVLFLVVYTLAESVVAVLIAYVIGSQTLGVFYFSGHMFGWPPSITPELVYWLRPRNRTGLARRRPAVGDGS